MRVLITGANRGIGLEFVRQFAGRGDVVYATARNPDGASALNALAQAHPALRVLTLDQSDPASVAALAETLADAQLDVLVNNAGVFPQSGGLEALDWDMMRQGFEINTLGPLQVSIALLGCLRAGGRRVIANISTQMGSIGDNTSGGSYAYRASKAALNMVTRSMAHDLSGEGFTAMVIHPGWVQTDMGGPNAKITTEQSVSGMIALLDAATPDTHSGRFFAWSGGELPW